MGFVGIIVALVGYFIWRKITNDLCLLSFRGKDSYDTLRSRAERTGQLSAVEKVSRWRSIVFTVSMLLSTAFLFSMIFWFFAARGAMDWYKPYAFPVVLGITVLMALLVLVNRRKVRAALEAGAHSGAEKPETFHICRIENPARLALYVDGMVLTAILTIYPVAMTFFVDVDPGLTLLAWFIVLLIGSIAVGGAVRENRRIIELAEIGPDGIRYCPPDQEEIFVRWEEIERIYILIDTIRVVRRGGGEDGKPAELTMNLLGGHYSGDTLFYMIDVTAPDDIILSGRGYRRKELR